MSTEALISIVLTCIIGIMLPPIAWLIHTVLTSRERLSTLEHAVARATEDIAEVKSNAITQDKVRDVINDALDRRDRIHEARRLEWDRRLGLEVKDIVSQELEKHLPRLARDLDAKLRESDDERNGSRRPPKVQG